MSSVLRVDDITMQFGGVVAVDNLSLSINKGEIVALIGPNGAGKTTAFNVITGVYAPTNGRVLIDGKEVVSNHPQGKMKKLYKGKNNGKYRNVKEQTPDKITKLGMARTFQNIRLFKDLTVFDNVLIAYHLNSKLDIFSASLRLPNAIKKEKYMREETKKLLEKFDLYRFKDDIASSLPYGQQRRLEQRKCRIVKSD